MSFNSPSAAIEHLEREAGRVREIVHVLVKYQLAGWLSAIPIPSFRDLFDRQPGTGIKDLPREERIRLAITELGTTFIKLGQLLSTREDLIGSELASELSKLQSQTQPDPPEVVRTCIEEELGKSPEEIFTRFEPEAFASASVAQVHRAVLESGEQVVVKIQKAGIRKKIEDDLSIMTSLAELAEKHSPELKSYEPVRLVAEFRRTILRELDFTRELKNLDTFGRNFAGDESVHFPNPWPEYSSRRVLTMELLDGILGTDIAKLRESGEDLTEFARRGAQVYLEMIFRDSFYHADPHPGNLMLLPNEVVGILDCGMVGRLDDGLHDDFESLMLAVSQGDAEILTDTFWKLSSRLPGVGRDQLKMELAEFLADSTQTSLGKIDLSETLTNLSEIIRKYHIRLRPGLTGLLKTLVLLEGTAKELNPEFNLTEVMEPYYDKILAQRFSPQRLGRRFQRSYRDWDRLIQTLPRDISQSLEQAQEGKFQIRLVHGHLDAVVNRLVLGIIIASLILGSSLLWSLKAPPLLNGVSIFGAVGYLAAMFFGWLLYRAIEKSGKVAPKE